MHFKDKAKQQQDDCTGRTNEDGLKPFDTDNGFRPPFRADLFVDGE
jgi:hypothetical protein